MIHLDDKKVAEIVAENIKTAHVFKKYGLDFCCGGGLSVKKACSRQGIDFNKLKDDLLSVDQVPKEQNYNIWELDVLIDYIINVHHRYIEESIPLTLQYFDKVASVYGHQYPEVLETRKLFIALSKELESHLKKEEHILFPYIKTLVQTNIHRKGFTKPPFGDVSNPISVMETEHETAGDIFKRIAELTTDFTPPKEACNTFRALYAKLEEFEKDLHHHIHLENNILHPKAKALENQLLNFDRN